MEKNAGQESVRRVGRSQNMAPEHLECSKGVQSPAGEQHRRADLALVLTMGLLLFGMALWCWLRPAQTYSESERRVLATRPALGWEEIWSGEYMEDFESAAADQFPARDAFRGIKAAAELGLFSKLDNNGLYVSQGYVSKLEYPLQEKMLNHAANRFQYIYEEYMADTEAKLYFSIVPDKNFFLAEKSGRLSLDYEALIASMREKTPYMQYVDILPSLSLEDYYRTDTHWKQENLQDTAQLLAEAMNVRLTASYEAKALETPFNGVYTGQLALPLAPDTLTYLTNDMLENCTVTSYDTGKPVPKQVYDLEATAGRDPYEMYLSGSDALLVIENPAASTDRELIVFRDSYASSLIPLLVEAYSKITLVDIRYIQSNLLGTFIDFQNQDVLFLYSTLLLNNSLALR